MSPPHLSLARGATVGAATLAALALLLGLGGFALGSLEHAGALQGAVFVIEGLAICWLVALLSGVNDGISMHDHAGNLVYANRAAARRVGYPSVEGMSQAPLEELMKRFELFDERGAPFPPERFLAERCFSVNGQRRRCSASGGWAAARRAGPRSTRPGCLVMTAGCVSS